MISHSSTSRQLPSSFQTAFDNLRIGQHLRRAGITKNLGFSCLELFHMILMLVFQHKNWFRILESPDAETLPGKDAVYRFLNCLCIPFNSSTHYENNRPCIPISSVHRFWYLSSTTQTCYSMDITP